MIPPVLRLSYVVLALLTIGLGLAVHSGIAPLGPMARDIIGDALWASMVAWWIGALVPRAHLLARSAAAYGISALVEASQLWHTPFLETIRTTRLGRLVLGSGFDARDLLAYAFGVAATLLMEACWRTRRRRRPTPTQAGQQA